MNDFSMEGYTSFLMFRAVLVASELVPGVVREPCGRGPARIDSSFALHDLQMRADLRRERVIR